MSVALLSLVLLQDPQWNQWRGPNRDGLSPDTGLLKKWPAGGPPLAWKAAGLGTGYAGVSAWGDRLFTMGDEAGTSYLLALNRSDGKVVWRAPVGPAGDGGGYPGSRSTPATDGALVFALGPEGDLVAVESAGGKERWRKSLRADFGGRVGPWKYSESLLLDGDRVVCTPGGRKGTVAALKKASGETLWQGAELQDPAEYTSLVPADLGGVRQYVVFTMENVAGVSAADGKLLWRAAREGSTAVVPTPIHRDGIVFVASGYGVGSNAFRVEAEGGKFRARQIYSGDQLEVHHGGVLLLGDHLYALDDRGSMRCVEFKTGKEAWSDRSVGKGSIAYADGHFVVRGEDGSVALVEATPSGYRERGRFHPPDRSGDPSWPHPVVFGGRLYLRDHQVLHCYDVKAK